MPYRRAEKETIGSRFLEAAVREARERNLEITFVVFHDPRDFGVESWRDRFLGRELARIGVPHVEERESLRAGAERQGIGVREYFSPDGGPDARGNRAIAEALAELIRPSGS